MKRILILLMFCCCISQMRAQHPSIMLTKAMVAQVRAGIEKYPLLRESYRQLKQEADKALAAPINIPTPADGGGGITHEQHKKNYNNVLACGTIYQLTKDRRYLNYVKDMLLQYATVYPDWPRHPKRKQGEPGGRIFWQNLNDNVWGVYMIQGYDCIYEDLKKEDRDIIENKLFAEMVKELSEVNGKTFNLIHNHGTWSVAAVGMAGYVCGRKDWVDIALHGSAKDDKSGFLAQVRELFSPDGYYAEGPYYQRYAILPFMVFARAIQQHQPGLNIYNYHNGVLKKAVNTSLQCTYTNRAFFPLNDALKDKTYESEELAYAVDIAYSDFAAGNDLLDIARQQQRVILSDAGLKVAKAIAEGKAAPFHYTPMWINDGSDGNEGGLGILRSGPNSNQTCVVMKAASQGMGHGHFDRLNTIMYDNGVEVLDDYGSARFLNIETKSGGGYTKENDTWAKTTIAHNTLVVDRKSQYGGKVDQASRFNPRLIYFNSNENFQVVSAAEDHAYDGVKMLRTNILFKPKDAADALLIDIFRSASAQAHRYELPFWYTGHITDVSFPYKANTSQLKPLGENNGYQHIWLNAEGKPGISTGAITFLNNNKFYTTSFFADSATQVFLVTTGANDPDLNLRAEKAYIISQPGVHSHTFINITEPHGNTNPIAEFTLGFKPVAGDIRLVSDSDESTVFSFRYNKQVYTVQLRYTDKTTFLTIK